jgi:hypothetical protein
MEKTFEVIKQTKANFLALVEGLSTEQLNKIPEGFKNNIIWNFAHTVSAWQILVYKLSGLPFVIDENFVDLFKKGTKPERFFTEEEINQIKKLSDLSFEKLKLDYYDKVFTNFNEYETSFGVRLTCVEDAIKYASMHDGLHLGYSLAIRKLA